MSIPDIINRFLPTTPSLPPRTIPQVPHGGAPTMLPLAVQQLMAQKYGLKPPFSLDQYKAAKQKADDAEALRQEDRQFKGAYWYGGTPELDAAQERSRRGLGLPTGPVRPMK